MYVLVKIQDIVQIKPADFNIPSARLIEDSLNAKYADKVIPKIGLCVGVYKIDSCSDGLIGHSGTGIVNVHVDFQLVVFRPFKGEVILAQTNYLDEETGVWLKTDFFDEIVVPPEQLFENTHFQPDASGDGGSWVWTMDPTDESAQYFIDKTEIAAFKVESEEWHDVGLGSKKKVVEGQEEEEEEEEGPKQPYGLIGSMGLSGLGPKFWWTGDDTLEGQDGGAQAASADQGENGVAT
ncbi:hypothetical protein MBLNU230_g5750t1 [Neophaeotheca triangularis]